MGISLGSNFTVNTGLPLDDREQVADLAARDAIPVLRRWEGMVVYAVSEALSYKLVGGTADINWVEEGGGGGSIPVPTTAGEYLEYDGTDVVWTPGVFAGFSVRYNEAVNLASLKDALDYVFQLTYVGPLVSISATGSGTLREIGDVVASTTITANTTKRTDLIASVEFFANGISIFLNDPATFPNGGAEIIMFSSPFSTNTVFRADVIDDGTSGGPTTAQASVTFNFVYPYYFGAAAPGRTAAQVAALTKDIRVSTASLNRAFTTTAGQVYYFAYPASYGALSSILDENGFQTFSDWTLRTENITGLDATAQSYRIYEFNNPVGAGSTNFTFTR